MKIKHIMLISLLLVILTIGSVSAADNDIYGNLTVSEDSALESSTEDITLIQNEKEDTLTATPGTLSELRDEIDAAAGELNLTRDYAYSGSEYINVSVNYKITIDGQGHSIDCKKARNLFLIYDDNVTLKNIRFINCKSDGFDGSAIQWYGNAGTLQNCSFENCTSTMETSENSPNAGAIYWYGDNGHISNCSFKKCSAILLGGAIYWTGVNGSVSDCSFEKCSSVSSIESYTAGLASDGGAVYWAGSNGFLSNCSFKDCTASDKGDAIYWKGLNGTAIDCSFVKFSTDEYGAVYWSGNNGDFSNCTFVNCSSPTSVYGGILYWIGVNGSIGDCGFDSLTGYVIHLFGDNGKVHTSNFKNLTRSSIHVGGVNGSVINCSFENCSSPDQAGAIEWEGINGSIINCSFINCSAYNHGGAVYWVSEGGVIEKSTFKKCSSFSTYGEGGALYMGGNNCNVSECNFEGCHADTEGGALFMTGNNCNVSECNFEGCRADNQGGAIHWEGSNGTVSNCSFENCSAGSVVGAIIWLNTNSRGQIQYSNFTNCYAPETKAIYTSNKNLSIYSCRFEDNTTNDLNDLVSTGNITKCILNGNLIKKNLEINITASDIIYGNDAIVIVSLPTDATSNVTLSLANRNVTAYPEGGLLNYMFSNLTAGAYTVTAIYSGDDNYYPSNKTANFIVNKKTPILSIAATYSNHLTILVNLTADYGNVTINIDNSSFFVVEIKNGTGVLNVSNLTPETYYISAEFLGNDNYKAAAANMAFTINSTTTFKYLQDLIDAAGDELTLTSNFTYTYGDGPVTINKTITINGNGHTIDGAGNASAFEIEAGDVRISNINFKNCRNATGDGGAINWNGHGGSVSDSTFINCSANNGGAIYTTQQGSGFNNCNFINCSATQNGGAINCNDMIGFTINCNFTNCSADNGGAIYNRGEEEEIINCSFIRCHASTSGGSVYSDTYVNNCKIDSSEFINSTAANGPTVYDNTNNLEIKNSNFVDKSAARLSDVIYGGIISNCTLNGNLPKDVDLEISISSNITEPCHIGDSIEFTVTVTNNGPSDATGAYVSIIYPDLDIQNSYNTVNGSIDGGNSSGEIFWTIGNLPAGQTATLTITGEPSYIGNITYALTAYSAENDTDTTNNAAYSIISVLAKASTLTIDTNISGSSVTLTFTAPADATGTISVTVDGTNYNLTPVGGKASLNRNFSSGTHQVSATYSGDANYMPTTNNKTFTVDAIAGNTFTDLQNLIDAAGSTLNLTDDYIYSEGDSDFITIDKTITIDGEGHSINGNNTQRAFLITADNVVLKNINFEHCRLGFDYGGTIYWQGNNGTLTYCSFTNCYGTSGSSGPIYWQGDDGKLTDCNFINCTSTETPGGAINWYGNNGTVANSRFTNCSSTYGSGGVINWGNTSGIIENSDFTTFEAQMEAHALYLSNDNIIVRNCRFNDERYESFNEIIIGGNVIDCTLNGNAPIKTIDLSLIINSNITSCNIGDMIEITVVASNEGPDNATGAYVTLDCPISLLIKTQDTLKGSTGYGNGTGDLIWTIGNLTSGETATLTITAQAIQTGNMTLIGAVSANENDAYAANNMALTQITSIMKASALTIDANITGNNVTLTFTLKENNDTIQNEIISIMVGNVNFNGATDANGMYILSSTFPAGTYQVSATFGGNDYYMAAQNETTFTVEKKTATLTIDVNITANNVTLTFTIPEDATGNISVIVDGTNYVLNPVNGTRTLTNEFYPGTYQVIATYSGDANYMAANNETSFTVIATNTFTYLQMLIDEAGETLTLTNDFIYSAGDLGQVTINKTITIDGKGHTIDANHQSRIFTITADEVVLKNINFKNGREAGNGGSIYWGGNSGRLTNCSFTDSSSNTNGGAIYWQGANGAVEDSRFTDCSALQNGSSIYWSGSNGTVSNSAFTNKNESKAAIHATGNDVEIINSNFDRKSAVEGGTMKQCTYDEVEAKNATDITLTAHNIEIGDSQIIEAYLASDATGNVTFEVYKNNTLVKTSSAAITGGSASIVIANLAIGSYRVEAIYPGDERYNETRKTTSFKVMPKVAISQGVSVGSKANIHIDFGEKITDSLIVKIDKKTFGVADIEEGIVNYTFTTAKLKEGNHTVTFDYEGDLFESDIITQESYHMYLIPEEIPIPEEMKSNDDGVVTLEFPINATGTLTVYIDGKAEEIIDVGKELKEFLAQSNKTVEEIVVGLLKIDLSKYKGNVTVTFEYSGDENYQAFEKESNATIHVNTAIIMASNANVLYSAGPTYTIKVYSDKNVLAKSGKVVIKANNKAFKTLTIKNGIASFKVTQVPGTYKLTISALGKTKTTTLTVKHVVTLKTVTVKRSAKKLVLQATLSKVNKKYLKNKKITFKFNGKTYTAKTNKKGVAKVTIKSTVLKKLKVGKKVTYQATYLKDTVKKTAKIKK